MRWIARSTSVLLVAAGLAVAGRPGTVHAIGSIRSVCSFCTYHTVQAAVNAAANGDEVLINGGGTYAGFTDTAKSITVTASGAATLSGGGPVVTIGQAGGGSQPSVVIQNLTIANGNSGATNGGGILNYGTLTVTGTTITNNTSSGGEGGGIANAGTLVLLNSTVISNSANGYGGGVYTSAGTATLLNDTIVLNSAGYGGGVFNGGGTIQGGNSMLAGNSAGISDPDCWGTVTDDPGHNLIQTTSVNCSGPNAANGDLLNVNPLMGTFGSWGGPTQVLPPLFGSPVLGTGDATTCQATGTNGVNGVDQRGLSRPTSCSIGSVDAGTWQVDGTNGSDPTGCLFPQSVTFKTIPAALACAAEPDTVSLAAGSYPGGITISRSVTLTGPPSGASLENGGSVGSVVTINAGTVTLKNLTLLGGVGTPNANTWAYGGGVYVGTATVNVTDCTIELNSTTGALNQTKSLNGDGGGIYAATGSDVTLDGSTVEDNTSDFEGGGIYSAGKLTIANSVIQSNSLTGSGNDFGAGVYAAGDTLSISGSTIEHNSGGDAIDSSDSLNLDDSTVINNMGGAISLFPPVNSVSHVMNSTVSVNSGGGLFVAPNNTGDYTILVGGSTFTGNSAAAIYICDCGPSNLDAQVSNSTIAGNSWQWWQGDEAGGIVNSGAKLTVTNSTVSGNSVSGTVGNGSASAGGLITFSGGTTILNNTILAKNTTTASGTTVADCFGTVSGTSNLLGDPTGCTGLTNGINGNQVGTAAHPLDPLLGALANNSGPTQTMLPAANSPAIDMGSEAICTQTPINNLDQRGFSRPDNGENACDIGSVETRDGATASPVLRFTVTHLAHGLLARWRLAPHTPAIGFTLRAHGTQLGPRLISTHRSRSYLVPVPVTAAGPYRLRILLAGGTSTTVRSG